MSTTGNTRSVFDLIESAKVSRGTITPEEQKEATRRILSRLEKARQATPVDSIDGETQSIAKIKPRSIRERGLFWLSQLGAFTEAILKGRHNKAMAVRVYEMVQSIS